ncbi:hypothetical protein QQZ08_005898 [Neonectria magnoliae]|uniref:Uncharacterized protein n=1 Tax=Neonectria magnoliae TaxID=2732573 RepID=A0ABR1I3Y3_9HYPO
MSVITVFEDPWPEGRKQVPLEKAAVQHLELVEIFLKLLPHFQTDENGNIHDEALVYSEWRYISYLRFLYARGFAPCDHPPPWDVALIWYLHLLSPTRFHQYFWSSQATHKAISYGLEHRHFPLTALLSGEWSPKKTRRMWDAWNSSKGDRPGPELPYQLWSSPPWEGRRRSSLFSRFLNRDPAVSHDENRAHQNSQFERRIVMHWWNRCYLGHSDNLPAIWDVKFYTTVRTWQREERCRAQSHHEQFRQECDLRPWPSVQDLREDLERQIPFWRALVQTKSSKPAFVEGLPGAIADYENFIGLFHGKLPKARAAQYVSRLDPKMIQEHSQAAPILGTGPSPVPGRYVRIVPPTLEVDLLWHTHRLFPGKYWVWTSIRAGWVIDVQVTVNAGAAEYAIRKTKEEWKMKYTTECPTINGIGEWLPQYVPETATFAPEDAEKGEVTRVVKGLYPFKGRRVPLNFKRSYGDPGGGGGSGDGGGSGSGGGDGGGGGGGGGDGGG